MLWTLYVQNVRASVWAFFEERQKCKITLDYNRRELLKHDSGREKKRDLKGEWKCMLTGWLFALPLCTVPQNTWLLCWLVPFKLCCIKHTLHFRCWVNFTSPGRLNMFNIEFENIKYTRGVIEEFKNSLFLHSWKQKKHISFSFVFQQHYFDSLTAASLGSDSTFPPLLSELVQMCSSHGQAEAPRLCRRSRQLCVALYPCWVYQLVNYPATWGRRRAGRGLWDERDVLG